MLAVYYLHAISQHFFAQRPFVNRCSELSTISALQFLGRLLGYLPLADERWEQSIDGDGAGDRLNLCLRVN